MVLDSKKVPDKLYLFDPKTESEAVMIKKIFLGTFILACLLTTGIPGNATDWEGFYAGINSGAGTYDPLLKTSTVYTNTGYFSKSSVTSIDAVGDQGFTSPANLFAGLQLGYNFDLGGVILGVETDFGAMSFDDGRTVSANYPCCPGTGYTITQSAKTDWVWTVRPRLGFVAGKVLIYGTSGLAFTQIDQQASFTDTFDSATESGGANSIGSGLVLGTGIEYQLGDGLSLNGEYLFMNIEQKVTSSNLNTGTEGAFPSSVFTHTVNFLAHIGRVVLNFKL